MRMPPQNAVKPAGTILEAPNEGPQRRRGDLEPELRERNQNPQKILKFRIFGCSGLTSIPQSRAGQPRTQALQTPSARPRMKVRSGAEVLWSQSCENETQIRKNSRNFAFSGEQFGLLPAAQLP